MGSNVYETLISAGQEYEDLLKRYAAFSLHHARSQLDWTSREAEVLDVPGRALVLPVLPARQDVAARITNRLTLAMAAVGYQEGYPLRYEDYQDKLRQGAVAASGAEFSPRQWAENLVVDLMAASPAERFLKGTAQALREMESVQGWEQWAPYLALGKEGAAEDTWAHLSCAMDLLAERYLDGGRAGKAGDRHWIGTGNQQVELKLEKDRIEWRVPRKLSRQLLAVADTFLEPSSADENEVLWF